jgi:hypothetical protein
MMMKSVATGKARAPGSGKRETGHGSRETQANRGRAEGTRGTECGADDCCAAASHAADQQPATAHPRSSLEPDVRTDRSEEPIHAVMPAS